MVNECINIWRWNTWIYSSVDCNTKRKIVMEKNIGDLVWLDGCTSFAQQNSQEEFEIEKKEYRFDEITGEKYPIYFVNNKWFDGRDGNAYKNESMYYVEL